MSGLDYLKLINDIDADLIEAANVRPVKKKNNWIAWVALAASIFLIAGLGLMVTMNRQINSDQNNNLVSFRFEGNSYECLSANDLIALGINLNEDISGRATAISDIDDSCLGSLIGEVTLTIADEKKTVKLYHYAACPEDDSICILDLGDGCYRLYKIKE